MKAVAHLQVVPEFTSYNAVRSVKVVKLTQARPRDPEPNALVVKVVIDVDEAIFAVPELEIALDADGSELAAAVVPVPVAEETSEVTS